MSQCIAPISDRRHRPDGRSVLVCKSSASSEFCGCLFFFAFVILMVKVRSWVVERGLACGKVIPNETESEVLPGTVMRIERRAAPW